MANRDRQKARTRQAIVAGCAELIDSGATPTIDEIAAHTGISRATIYRYFNKASDVVFTVLSDRDTDATVDTVDAAGAALEDRVAAAERAVNDYLFANPSQLRQFVASALQRQLDEVALADDRPARRLQFIDRALEPLAENLGTREQHLLRFGLALAIGAESYISLVDTCNLTPTEAREVTQWVCRALVAAAGQAR